MELNEQSQFNKKIDRAVGSRHRQNNEPDHTSNSYRDSMEKKCTVYEKSEKNTKLKTVEEPLFVEDRTNSFQLKHEILYDSYEKSSTPKIDSRPRHMNACWNCGSTDHSLHNCPEPRNPRMISQNRQLFLVNKMQQQQSNAKNLKKRSSGRQNVRYFLDEPNNICSDFIPGQLSDELSEALGLSKNGIPVHVYRMREHGYPSGWLEDAREHFSGISIFTAPNECLPLPGRGKEGNNLFCSNINQKKLHAYPGFNAPYSEETVDNHAEYGCPKYNPEQSLKLMYERLNTNFEVAQQSGSKSSSDNTNFTLNSNGILLKNVSSLQSEAVEEKLYKAPSSPEDGEITDENSNPSDVESSSKNRVEEPVPDKIVNEESTSINVSDVDQSVSETQLSTSIKSENNLTPIFKGVKRKFGDVKSEVLGTPVLKHFSSYVTRPTHEKFAKGMVDMVDHENLPNAVGNFKKLKEILKNVRETLSNAL